MKFTNLITRVLLLHSNNLPVHESWECSHSLRGANVAEGRIGDIQREVLGDDSKSDNEKDVTIEDAMASFMRLKQLVDAVESNGSVAEVKDPSSNISTETQKAPVGLFNDLESKLHDIQALKAHVASLRSSIPKYPQESNAVDDNKERSSPDVASENSASHLLEKLKSLEQMGEMLRTLQGRADELSPQPSIENEASEGKENMAGNLDVLNNLVAQLSELENGLDDEDNDLSIQDRLEALSNLSAQLNAAKEAMGFGNAIANNTDTNSGEHSPGGRPKTSRRVPHPSPSEFADYIPPNYRSVPSIANQDIVPPSTQTLNLDSKNDAKEDGDDGNETKRASVADGPRAILNKAEEARASEAVGLASRYANNLQSEDEQLQFVEEFLTKFSSPLQKQSMGPLRRLISKAFAGAPAAVRSTVNESSTRDYETSVPLEIRLAASTLDEIAGVPNISNDPLIRHRALEFARGLMKDIERINAKRGFIEASSESPRGYINGVSSDVVRSPSKHRRQSLHRSPFDYEEAASSSYFGEDEGPATAERPNIRVGALTPPLIRPNTTIRKMLLIQVRRAIQKR